MSQIKDNKRPIPSCAGAPNAHSKGLSQQANFTSLQDSAKYTFRIRSYNLQLVRPPNIVALLFAARCTTPSRLKVCLSPFEASSQAGAYDGLSLLVVSGRAAGFFSRNMTSYQVIGSGIAGQRELVLREAMPATAHVPDETSVVALIDLGELLLGRIQQPRAGWSEYAQDRDVTVSRQGSGAAPLASLIDKFMRIDSGSARGLVRRIVSVFETENALRLDPPFAQELAPAVGDLYEILEYRSALADLADGTGAGIQLHGPPMEPQRLSAVQTFSGSALLDWQQPSICDTKPDVVAPCDVAEAYLEAKMTHNSGDFLVQGTWGDYHLVVPVLAAPNLGLGLFTGLAPLASFQVRVRVRHKHVIDFGGNSNSFLMKLTDNPPATQATVGLLTDLGSSDSMVLTWTIPGTLDFDTPPYVTQVTCRPRLRCPCCFTPRPLRRSAFKLSLSCTCSIKPLNLHCTSCMKAALCALVWHEVDH